MNWRERAREIQKCPSGEVSKASKGPYEPFEATEDGQSERFQRRHAALREEASDAKVLTDFRAALLLGKLIVCGNCLHFTPGTEPGGPGHCRQFGTETWPFVPFICSGFTVSPTPLAPAYLPDLDGARAPAGAASSTTAMHSRRRAS